MINSWDRSIKETAFDACSSPATESHFKKTFVSRQRQLLIAPTPVAQPTDDLYRVSRLGAPPA